MKYGATWIQKLQYVYTNGGNLTAMTDQVNGGDSVTMTYDALHRLKTATGLWGGFSYVYDPLNNLRSRTGPSALTYSYDGSTNRLSGITGAQTRTYAYNAKGEITGDGIKTFTVNADGQIASITGVASYAYDGNGKRIRVTPQSGSAEYALYTLGGDLVYSEEGTEQTDYLKLGGQTLVKLKKTGGVTTEIYLHPDLLGSPRKATTAAGAILWQEHFDPYGAKLNGVVEKIGYTGHAHDAGSGYTYMQARFYDPLVGRFLSTDPIHFQDGDPFTFNRYAYANNSPYRFIDPDGRATVYRYADKIIVVQTFKNNGTQFTNEQITAQGAGLSGQTSDGKTVVVRFVPGSDKDSVQLNPNAKLDDTSSASAMRSHADKIGGRIVEIAPNAAGSGTVGHEFGHVLRAGDQYSGGIGADGKKLSSDVAGPENIMKNAVGTANTQTIDEIYKGSSSNDNTQVDCTKGAQGGCE